MSSTYLSKYGRTLIDEVFHEQNQELLKAMHERLERLDRREQLAQLCGTDDQALLDHLMDLEIEPEALAAITVVPLVVVAWADGSVQAKEREAILKSAQAAGIPSDDGRYPVLDYWLRKKPRAELLKAWELYIRAICQQLNPVETDELMHDLLDRAQDVAAAAGGILGFGNKISSRETEALEQLRQAFESSK